VHSAVRVAPAPPPPSHLSRCQQLPRVLRPAIRHLALAPTHLHPPSGAPCSTPRPTPPTPLSRYFQTAAALATHEKTKPHRRRAKMLLSSARPHNQTDAEVASGMGRPDNGPRLRSGGGVSDMAE
jgi:hypothetical protein